MRCVRPLALAAPILALMLTNGAAVVAQGMPDLNKPGGSESGPSAKPGLNLPGLSKQGDSGSFAETAFKNLDRNSDGIVSEEEYFGPQEDRFDSMDANKDGRLTLQEFRSGGGPFGRLQQSGR